MSWNFSAALVAEYLGTCFVDTTLSARLNSMRTVEQFSCGDKTTETFHPFRYGMTCEHLTDDDGEALLTWYREDFLANRSVVPENNSEPTTNETCLGKPFASYKKCNPNSFFSKTSRSCSEQDVKLAYVAGLVDGEGCIRICSMKGKRKPTHKKARNVSYQASIQIAMSIKARQVLTIIQQELGGTIYEMPQKTNPKWEDQIQWRITGDCAEKLIEQIEPFLILKQAQAELIKRLAALRKHKTIWTKQIQDQAENLKQQMHALNKRGRGSANNAGGFWEEPDLFGFSKKYSKPFPASGTMRNGVCWARPTLAHRTTENAAGFWHTPTVVQRSRSEAAWEKRQKQRNTTGRKTVPPGSLEEQVLMSGDTPCWDWNTSPANPRSEAVRQMMIPTPRAQDALNRTNPCQYRRAGVPLAAWAAMFPTPRTGGMCGGSGSYQKLKDLMGKGVITPKERRGMAAGNGGKLNPEWTEWLIGVPVGWSGLEPLVMPKCRSAPLPHGEFCTNESMNNEKEQDYE